MCLDLNVNFTVIFVTRNPKGTVTRSVRKKTRPLTLRCMNRCYFGDTMVQ